MDQGIFGGFRNKVGKVVGAYWRDLNVVKALPRVSNKAATQAQLNQRLKFGLVTGFLSYMSDLIDAGYGTNQRSSSPMNEAVAYHLKNSVTGIAPNFMLDYTKLKFSKGKLSNPSTCTVDTTAAGKVDYNWSLDGPDRKNKDATDVINVMAYNPAKDRFVTVLAAAPRSAQTFVLQFPPDFTGDEVYCYFSFTSTRKKNLHSDSVFVFTMVIA